MTEWTARRIVKELCDPDRRREILACFWKEADADSRNLVTAALARNMNFRLESIRKAPMERKSELLAQQLHRPEFDEPVEIALMLYHTSHAKGLLSAFLDSWKIPHQDGSIETEDYKVPTPADVTRSVDRLKTEFSETDIALYLVTAGLLMGRDEPKWRESTWPAAEKLLAGR